ncbi:hypothetical protein EDC04DRAFT_2913524 [Pisolithus marmoratus]|nr:hypothetical protein EDC04DRAFT_2913524 [Pisolithus marmoratus]
MVITWGEVDQSLHKQAEAQVAHASANLSQGAHSSALQSTTNACQGAHSSALQVNTNISQGAMSSLAMQVTTNASQLAPGIADETMKSPSLMSTEDTAMKSPLVGADEPSSQVNELTMASPSPSAFSPRSPMPMQGSSLMDTEHIFKYCMHLTFLKEIRACASADTNVDEAAACDDLQPWFNEKNYSTFAHLHSLQHSASAIAFSTMALPSVWWTDTEAWSSLSFKGNHIAFSDVCKIFQDVEEDSVSTWENKVLKGLKLRVDYEHIVDDPSNRNVGYAFLFDSRNACFQDQACLVRSVVEGHGPFAGFLLHRDDKLIWNKAALHAWLQDYAGLQKLLLMCAEMLSGAPSRGTELTAMLYRNTQA